MAVVDCFCVKFQFMHMETSQISDLRTQGVSEGTLLLAVNFWIVALHDLVPFVQFKSEKHLYHF